MALIKATARNPCAKRFSSTHSCWIVGFLQHLKLPTYHPCRLRMKSLAFYLCLLATLLQAIFASSSLNKGRATLSTHKESDASKPKRVVGKSVKQEKSKGVKKPQGKNLLNKNVSKSKNVVVSKEDKSKLLIDLLPKVVVEIVIGYFNDNLYPIIISAHNWLLRRAPRIAVDSARLYVLTESEGLQSVNHSCKYK